MDLALKLLYTRKEAAAALSVSVSTLDVMIARGMLRTIRKGRRVMISKAELERAARRDDVTIWPPKNSGKTRRVILPATADETNGSQVLRGDGLLVLEPHQ